MSHKPNDAGSLHLQGRSLLPSNTVKMRNSACSPFDVLQSNLKAGLSVLGLQSRSQESLVTWSQVTGDLLGSLISHGKCPVLSLFAWGAHAKEIVEIEPWHLSPASYVGMESFEIRQVKEDTRV
jgi:hypothetical protein